MIAIALSLLVGYFVGAFYPFPGWFVGTAIWRVAHTTLRRLHLIK
jgi:hypothetical protein